jgi:metal-dependent hydrolase (beta-lactamase superfamily II)
MIEGPNAVVIFDGQLLLPYADEVASYVQTLGKPVDRIILSHAHTDHWAGLQVLTERFPNAYVFALEGIAEQVRDSGPARLDRLGRTYGDRAATMVTIPTKTISEGLQRIDGVAYDFKRFVNAESDLQLAALLPEQKSVDGVRSGVFTERTRLHRCESFRSLDDRSRVAQGASRLRHDHHRA